MTTSTAWFQAEFDNSYARELEGAFVDWSPASCSRPTELFFNGELADELGILSTASTAIERAAVFSGQVIPEGARPIAQAYAGHQFGGFSPQLGDGRALLLGEVFDRYGRRRDLAFKGSGRTPFSRGGDGKAAVGPMLREVLIGEALHALGIPTTRALAVVATGDWVHRDRSLPGAVLTRVAASHLRVGTFEYFAARGDEVRLRLLLRYAAARHSPQALEQPDPALVLLQQVVDRQADLVAQWLAVGFIHGVMNTDNMTISGETIDFGPCAFLEAHDPATVYSSIDHHGRYAYGNQAAIAQWNLARLAEALMPVMESPESERIEKATAVVRSFSSRHEAQQHRLFAAKLGWATATGDGAAAALGTQLQALMQQQRVDHTLAWRRLADAAQGQLDRWLDLFSDPQPAQEWQRQWQAQTERLLGHAPDPAALRRANPGVIARNHEVEAALSAASDQGELQPLNDLLLALRRPFDDGPLQERYSHAAPQEVTAKYVTFCGT